MTADQADRPRAIADEEAAPGKNASVLSWLLLPKGTPSKLHTVQESVVSQSAQARDLGIFQPGGVASARAVGHGAVSELRTASQAVVVRLPKEPLPSAYPPTQAHDLLDIRTRARRPESNGYQ